MIGKLINPMDYCEYGILSTIVLACALLFVLATFNRRKQLNVVSYIIALVLLFPLTYQMNRLIGACDISSTASDINDFIGSISPTLKEHISSVTTKEINRYIFRRALWSVLFIAIGGVGIWATMTPKRKKYHATYDDYDSNVSPSTDEWGL
ncbi:MAG: hypothetical protein J1E57_04215 [Prevotella sp.]|nr:hypothetical protein [Prevotella sp.]